MFAIYCKDCDSIYIGEIDSLVEVHLKKHGFDLKSGRQNSKIVLHSFEMEHIAQLKNTHFEIPMWQLS